MIEVGNIIKNLIPTEAVVVNKIQKLGTMYSLKFTGVNTNKSSSKVITEEQFSSLEVLTSDGEVEVFQFTREGRKECRSGFAV